ncbi:MULTISPECIES: TIGR00645 family protein [unclassified Pseudoalteromonas]|uniref:TIGR00645 family protein n=1 Tax=unclassified Pseudoalteromonas TaxID=194690 RepID=UPI0025B54621|nr:MULTISPECIES: TIGR00645 family protein [unclassified Pseudoalteromonas]MDN3377762.1 TIGR00645 family protein [Pseudoalteromonas sp. APC 3893]MDN3385958.1 TIGR00645 family protein [Pseudoalteromonas sp. APC 4017]
MYHQPSNKTPRQAGKAELVLESFIFRGRWLLAPFFVGLLFAVILLLIKFFKQLYLMGVATFTATNQELLVGILTLVDTALLAGLLLIIIFSGYENFVSKLNIDNHEDRPVWMGKVGFSGLKMKLISAIVAISAVELLKVFISSSAYTSEELILKVVIHVTFVISGVLFALTDFINSKTQSH